MIGFAVTVAGLSKEGQAHWVLDVQGKRLLIVHEDQSFHWHHMDECRFVKLVPPDAPVPVIVAPEQKPKLLVPGAAGNGRVS